MSVLLRYIEILAAAQFFAFEKGTYLTDRQAFHFAGNLVSLVPMVHAGVLFGTLDLLAHNLHLLYLDSAIVRGLIFVPFFAVSIFLMSDYDYLLSLRNRIRSESPEVVAARRHEARTFTRNTYIVGLLMVVAVAVSRV